MARILDQGRIRKNKSIYSSNNWNAQYMQQPTAEEGAIIKRDWWQNWEDKDPPKCEFKIQSYDTAFLKKRIC